MDQFIRPHRQNMRQPGFWKIANGGSDDEADLEDQIESQATEALDKMEQACIDYTISRSTSITPSDSVTDRLVITNYLITDCLVVTDRLGQAPSLDLNNVVDVMDEG